MQRPIVFIHGYSANGAAFDPLRDALVAYCGAPGRTPLDPAGIDICTYVSLNNEITITDISEGLDRAFRNLPQLAGGQDFDAVVHSTGMLVIRAWLANQARPVDINHRLKRLKHLIGIAPATWGSPQAHKGRTLLGALVKGDKSFGPDFLNAGDRVLENLELASSFTWNLAHLDLLGKQPFYDTGTETPFVSVFIGNRPYDGVSSIANSPGTDGTVRWSGCALNTRKITLDLTRTPLNRDGKDQRFSITPWVDSRTDIPMIAVDDRNHSSIIAQPDGDMVGLIADFLQVGDPGGETYDGWLERAREYGKKGRQRMLVDPAAGATLGEGEARRFFEHLIGDNADTPLDGWQQFVVRAVDTHGDGIDDFFLELLLVDADGTRTSCQQILNDVHAYGPDNSFRCFHVKLPQGITESGKGLIVRIHASTGTELMCYQGYGDNQEKLTATAEPVELNISELAKEAGSFFCPFTTTLIEIQLNREPLPLQEMSRLLTFLPQKVGG
jgi:pimeloyl-ACP methyl ester carboxylesterase